ncbi:Ricin-type beta-trefoil lectin domain-containing protein [Lentzea fradiae]|uniref:Ricin-type beta-trefoil lectin domain-containing protein n=1 Tax=Lentzea fradiae TaxID=200378 RepID=A0A1G7RCE7_9PSEU|nr:ThuA domain-containing protein [Lentzea fradiae]SDG08447.1 Ricin-type beta-trefoil lectin domain-containing protein [Lentzea fradiae]
MARTILALLALVAATLVPAGVPVAQAAPFKVLAFYNGTWDAAHIAFVKEANPWLTRAGQENGFTYEATTDWNRLATLTPAQAQVVVFLDDAPTGAAARTGFQRYMEAGGGFFGFHVSAFTQNANEWPWYHNTFLAKGNFVSNTWGPTTAVLKVETRNHPSTARLPEKFTSAVSEWYSWDRDLRQNPDVQVLASVDPSSFPLGTDPDQQWRSGYYPIMWTNKNFRMVYANFGHDAMDYAANRPLSSTFASPTQNTFLVDSLLWLGGGTPPPQGEWKTAVNRGNGKCVDVRAAGVSNGTVVQQYSCNGTTAQQFRAVATSGGYSRLEHRNAPAKVLDVSDVSMADGAGVHLWDYVGGANQQWRVTTGSDGHSTLTARHSGKCLSAPAGSADGVQLVQATCDGSAAQSFRLG